jgi:predicted amino acid-binding ACT domain protein
MGTRWTEDRERERREQDRFGDDDRRWRGEEGWRGRGRRDDDQGDDWRVGEWQGGERGEWHGGAREWEARDRGEGGERERRERDRGEGEWQGRGEREWRGGAWRGGEGRGRYGERGGFGLGWRADEERHGPGTGRGASFGAGGMYGGAGGAYGGSSYGGSGLGGGYRGTFRDRDRGRGWDASRGDESGWGGADRGFDERESGFTRDLRRYGSEDENDGRGALDRMGDRMREGWRKLTGRGPKGYKRSDERIKEDVSERIARSWVNAEDVEVKVDKGEVTLGGFVESREEKRKIEDLAEDVFGVEEVQNHLRVRRRGQEVQSQTFTAAGQGQTQETGTTVPSGGQRGPQPGQPQQPGARH